MDEFRDDDFQGCFFMDLFNGFEGELRNKMHALHFFYCGSRRQNIDPTVNQTP